MIKRFAYIVILLAFMPVLSFALVKEKRSIFSKYRLNLSASFYTFLPDTTSKKHQSDDKKKIKEIARAKRQPKPEKVEDAPVDATTQKPKPKRQRRPEGLERPPEIPRRNGGG